MTEVEAVRRDPDVIDAMREFEAGDCGMTTVIRAVTAALDKARECQTPGTQSRIFQDGRTLDDIVAAPPPASDGKPPPRDEADKLALLVHGRLAKSRDLIGGSNALLFYDARATIDALEREIIEIYKLRAQLIEQAQEKDARIAALEEENRQESVVWAKAHADAMSQTVKAEIDRDALAARVATLEEALRKLFYVAGMPLEARDAVRAALGEPK